MRFLDRLELYLTEEREIYDIFPVDFDAENGISFAVDKKDDEDDKVLAKVTIKTLDGVPIDALSGNYNTDDVYADVSLEGDTDDPSKADLMLWLLKKLKKMGYDEQSIRFDGEVYYDKPETVSIVTNDENELLEPDDTFDASKYWDDESNEDEFDATKYWNDNDENKENDTENSDETETSNKEQKPEDEEKTGSEEDEEKNSSDEEENEDEEDEIKIKKKTKVKKEEE